MPIFMVIIVFFLWKSNVDYPFASNVSVFQRLWITHLLNMLLRLWTTHFLSKFWFTFFLAMFISREKIILSMEEVLLPLGICNRKINLFVSPLHTYKETKHGQCLEALQRSHKSTYQRNLMAHIQNMELLWPNMSHHPTSSTPLSKWQDPSWIHWHFIIKHHLNMVYTSFGTLISSSKRFWNIS